jgi:hypothetical protein
MKIPPLLREFCRLYFAFYPNAATERGFPGFDDRTPCFSREAFERFASAVGEMNTRLDTETPRDIHEEIDLLLFRSALEAGTFFPGELDWIRTNPVFHVGSLIESVEELDLREDLTPARRDACLERRMRGSVAALEGACRELREPVDCLIDAAVEMLDAAIHDFGRRFRKRSCAAPLYGAAEGLRRAFGKARDHLQRVRPDAKPFEPMGPERYLHLLRFLHFLEGDPGRYRRIGEEAMREAEVLLGEYDPSQVPDDPPPPDFGADQVWEYYRQEVAFVRRFVEENRLVRVPDGDVRIREIPPTLAPLIGGACYQPPPAFRMGGRQGQFFVRPIPRKMTAEQKGQYHRNIRNRWRRNTIVHELYPGHHVQFLHAAAHPSGVRKLQDNDIMVEGWALYCEKLLVDTGLFRDHPSPAPARDLYFRGVRVFADLGLHTGEMSFDQARAYMEEKLRAGASGWVHRELVRYITEPAQALSYAVGRRMILDLREEILGDQTGAGSPLFDFHNRFLAEGSIPIPLIRKRLLSADPGPY